MKKQLIAISDCTPPGMHAMKRALKASHSEEWWHRFLQQHFLKMQHEYVLMLPKLNISIGATTIPDFLLVTKDNRVDVMEIKQPQTLLTCKRGGHYAPSNAIAASIVQVKNYIRSLVTHSDAIRRYLSDTYNLNVNIFQPEGIILAGSKQQFASEKQKNDFLLFWEGIHGVKILTYDDLK